MMYDDNHFCPDCWDARSAAAPPRCKRPTMHMTTRVMKVTAIFEDDQGGKTIVETDDFDYVELDMHRTDEPQAWLDNYRQTLMNNDHEIRVHIHRVRTYRVYPGDRPNPVEIEDPNVVESDGDGR